MQIVFAREILKKVLWVDHLAFYNKNYILYFMISAILQWIGLWLLLAIMVWPIFFALLHITIHTQRKFAIYFIIWISLSDILLAYIVAHWLSYIITWPYLKFIGSIVAWVIFLFIWITQYYKHLTTKSLNANLSSETTKELKTLEHTHTPRAYILQWFSMNTLYPWALVFWIGTVWQFLSNHTDTNHHTHVFIFLFSILITFFCTDLIKIALAERLKKILTSNRLLMIKKWTAIIMITIGVWLLVHTLIFT